jgi:hypothetical protein
MRRGIFLLPNTAAGGKGSKTLPQRGFGKLPGRPESLQKLDFLRMEAPKTARGRGAS